MTDDVQTAQDVDQAPRFEGTLSVQEAAAYYGVTEKTIRRRIKAGSLRAIKHGIAEGFEWRVYPGEGRLDNAMGTQATQDGQGPQDDHPRQGTHTEQKEYTSAQVQPEPQQPPELLRALDMIDRLQQEAAEKGEKIAELTGTAAHWQARAIIAEEQARRAEDQIKLLMAPKDEAEAEPPAVPEQVKPWWRRLLGG